MWSVVEGERVPSFAEWVSHCFADPVGEVQWDDLPPQLAATFLAQLFEQPDAWAREMSDAQANRGLWFICGLNGWFRDAWEPEVPKDLAIRWVLGLKNLYRDVFAKRCSPILQHRVTSENEDEDTSSPLNAVCYMLWDMDQLEGAAMLPGSEHLIDPIFEVLAYALSLDAISCQESALHGLGHLKHSHPKRVQRIIEAFLSEHADLPRELVEYAHAARAGRVQ